MRKSSLINAIVACSLLASSMLLAAEPSLQASHLSADMDTSTQPGDDFFAYANGTWLKDTSIPPDRSWFGVFAQLRDLSQKRVAELIRDTSLSAPAKGSAARQVADYYNAVMDEAAVEKKGTTRGK
jgi:putative endopeptidase